jgi:hypothetical protein
MTADDSETPAQLREDRTMIDHTRLLRQFLFALLAVLSSVLLPAHVVAAPTVVQDEDIAAIRAAAEELGDEARERLQPLPEGETRVFKAVVMATLGRAQWRGDEEVPWKNAEVNDLLEPGAMIRTGRNSSLVLRAGQNATILIDANTRLLLPEMIQEGQTLRTAVQLTRGRADFKVDRVGLTNDFSVVTPSATLAVRGTGYAARYGGLNGTEVFASRMNEMFAIELRYFLAQFTYYLSGGARSTEKHQNPVVAELFRTFGPPRILSALIEDEATPDLLIDSFERNPVYDQRLVDLAIIGREQIENLPIFDEPGEVYEFQWDYDFCDFEFEGVTGAGQVAEFICGYLSDIFDLYGQLLVRDGLGDEGISEPWSEISDLCYGHEVYDEQDLINILSVIVAYCSGRHDDPEDAGLCVLDFIAAFGEVWIENWQGE